MMLSSVNDPVKRLLLAQRRATGGGAAERLTQMPSEGRLQPQKRAAQKHPEQSGKEGLPQEVAAEMAYAQVVDFDPITLEIFWNRLIAIADQAGATLVRTSFSTTVQESNDYACVLLDTKGDALAENRGSVPSFVGCLSITMKRFLQEFPLETWRPGDIVITNDPWIGTGHRPDVTIAAPVFRNGELVAFTGSIAHWADMGGTVWAADCRSVFEEGIGIPPMKLMLEGKFNDTLVNFIRYNVRLPEQVMGDMHAMIAAAEVSSDRLIEFMDEYDLDSLEALGQVIQGRAESAMRQAISRVPDGVYHSDVYPDGFDERLHINCTLTVKGDEIEIDYSGSSEQVTQGGINCVSNFAWAYSTYTTKCLLDPYTHNNQGARRPIKVNIPEGCILNARYPAPVNVRHLVGHYVASSVMNALAPALPDRVIAESGSTPTFRTLFAGVRHDGLPFSIIIFANGGMGARPTLDGLPCTPFPTNTQVSSIEVMESITPLLVWKKEARPDSGGHGKFRGGYGQDIVVEVTAPKPITLSVISERAFNAAQGLVGGHPGATTKVEMVNGEQLLPRKGRTQLMPGDIIRLGYPGGGGYGHPEERDLQSIQEDLRNEIITQEAADKIYLLNKRLKEQSKES